MNRFLTWIYKQILSLYPSAFRREYRDQIILTLEDAYRESGSASFMFWCRAFTDLFQSIATERLRWIRRHLVASTVFAAAFASVAILAVGVILQQVLRRGADEPQLGLINGLAAGTTIGLPKKSIDIAKSSEVFVAYYLPDGTAAWSTGYLNGKIPSPPTGVFEHVASSEYGFEKLTWQPRPDVRLATVIKIGAKPNTGFFLAARSLWDVERRESRLRLTVLVTWVVMMLTILGAATSLSRRKKADMV